jgi:hypothetical protein
MIYEDRLLIYIDVLGFENYINHTEESRLSLEQKVHAVQRYLEMLKTITEDRVLRISSTKKFTCFSDLIVISIETKEIEFFAHEIMDLQYLLINSIVRGFLIRGAIVYGKLIHNEDFIFGPALIKGYKFERDIAKFPRIIVEESIAKDIEEYHSDKLDPDHVNFEESLKYDDDGYLYLDFISMVRHRVDNFGQYIVFIKKFSELMKNIADNPILTSKYQWLCRHYVPLIEKDDMFKWEFGMKYPNSYEIELFLQYMSEFDEKEYNDKL